MSSGSWFLRTVVVLGILILPMAHDAQRAGVFADEEKFQVSARVDKTEVVPGQLLQFQVSISGKLNGRPKVKLREIEGFRVVSSGQSQQLAWGARGIEQILTLTYTLAPTEVGLHQLGPVKVQVKDQVIETEPIEVEVVSRLEKKKSETPSLKGGWVL